MNVQGMRDMGGEEEKRKKELVSPVQRNAYIS